MNFRVKCDTKTIELIEKFGEIEAENLLKKAQKLLKIVDKFVKIGV